MTETCDDCKYFETGMSASDVSGVCTLKTEWEDKSLWWRLYYDPSCSDFVPDGVLEND